MDATTSSTTSAADLGGIYLLTGKSTGNTVTGNVVHDIVNSPSGYGGNGIYFDQGTSNVATTDNLVYRTAAAFITSSSSRRRSCGRRSSTTSCSTTAAARELGVPDGHRLPVIVRAAR